MKFHELGATGLRPSMIGLGTSRLGSLSSGITRAQAHKLIEAAHGLGINLIDTADSYGQGESEKRIGDVIRKNRDAYIIATKAGFEFTGFGGLGSVLRKFARPVLRHLRGSRQLVAKVRGSAGQLNLLRQNFQPGYIRRCVDSSLQRLRTGHIDLFFLHEPPQEVMLEEALFETLRELSREGKIRHFGVSSDHPEVLEAALAVRGLSVIQTPVNPFRAPHFRALWDQFHERGIGFLGNRIFAEGLAAGSNENAGELHSRLSKIAEQHGMEFSDVLLKFAITQCKLNPVLVGTLNAGHLAANVRAALSSMELSAQEIESLRETIRPA